MMTKVNIRDCVLSLILFSFGTFINRSITTDSHSLGENMKIYSEIFPANDGILQPHRFLLPLFGKVLNIDIQILNIIFLYVFILCCLIYLKNFNNHLTVLFFLAGFCSTMIFQFHINFGGYPDILSYLFLLLAYIFKEKKYFPYIMFLFALFTKETVIFTILFFLSLKNISKLKIIFVTILYLPVYFFTSTGVFNWEFYFNPLDNNILYWITQNSNYFLLGIFSSIKYFWFLLIYFVFKEKFNKSTYPIIFLLIGISFQFLLAGDITRLSSFIFLGIIYIMEKQKFKKVNASLILIAFLNVITVKYYVFEPGMLSIINESKLSFFDIFEQLRSLNLLLQQT